RLACVQHPRVRAESYADASCYSRLRSRRICWLIAAAIRQGEVEMTLRIRHGRKTTISGDHQRVPHWLVRNAVDHDPPGDVTWLIHVRKCLPGRPARKESNEQNRREKCRIVVARVGLSALAPGAEPSGTF